MSPVGDHILQVFITLYLTRFRTLLNNDKLLELLEHPKQKPWRVVINTCRKAIYRFIFKLTTFCFGVFIVN